MRVICFFLIFWSQMSLSGESARVGNGGGVLFCDNQQPQLLDIYESLFYEVASFENLKEVQVSTRPLLLEKRIGSFSPIYGRLLSSLRVFFHDKVSFLKNTRFKIPDDFANLFYESHCTLHVVAVQRNPILSFEKIFVFLISQDIDCCVTM